jgi:hypothetical protein
MFAGILVWYLLFCNIQVIFLGCTISQGCSGNQDCLLQHLLYLWHRDMDDDTWSIYEVYAGCALVLCFAKDIKWLNCA